MITLVNQEAVVTSAPEMIYAVSEFLLFNMRPPVQETLQETGP